MNINSTKHEKPVVSTENEKQAKKTRKNHESKISVSQNSHLENSSKCYSIES